MELLQDNFKLDLIGKKATINSLRVSRGFGKRHDFILRDIEKHIEKIKNLKFNLLNFEEIKKDNIYNLDFNYKNYFIKDTYIDDKNRTYPLYHLTQKGFNLLAMSYNGEKFIAYKIGILTAFEDLQKFKIEREKGKPQKITLNEAIDHWEHKNNYSYSTINDLILKKTTGRIARTLKKERGENKTALDLLTLDELEQYKIYENFVINTLLLQKDYNQVKNILNSI